MSETVIQRALEERAEPNHELLKLLDEMRLDETASMLDEKDFEAACLSLRFFGSCNNQASSFERIFESHAQS